MPTFCPLLWYLSSCFKESYKIRRSFVCCFQNLAGEKRETQRLTSWISCQDQTTILQGSLIFQPWIQPGRFKIMKDYPGNSGFLRENSWIVYRFWRNFQDGGRDFPGFFRIIQNPQNWFLKSWIGLNEEGYKFRYNALFT